MRARQRIMDATVDLIAGGGFAAVNIAAVAQRAGVSRQTVYAQFGSREDVVSQALSGVAASVLEEVRGRLSMASGAVEYLVELVVAGRASLRSHPVLAALLVAQADNPIFDTGTVARVDPVARPLLLPLAERGLVAMDDLDEILEVTVRLGLSVVAFDSEAVHDDDDLRAFLTRWLAPAVRPGPADTA